MLKQLTDAEHGTVLVTDCQTAGRGQRGNSWEAAPGLNLTFSILLRPAALPPLRQFEVSCVVALAVARMLDRALAASPHTPEVFVKWPNDIYVGDKKICGILIENVITGSRIDSCVAGIGLNINQLNFLSDAPNPVSLRQLTGREYRLDNLLSSLSSLILDLFDKHVQKFNAEHPDAEYNSALIQQYKQRLWRRNGYHPYIDNIDNKQFIGEIVDVEPTGHIIIRHADTSIHRYAFKEITPLNH